MARKNGRSVNWNDPLAVQKSIASYEARRKRDYTITGTETKMIKGEPFTFNIWTPKKVIRKRKQKRRAAKAKLRKRKRRNR